MQILIIMSIAIIIFFMVKLISVIKKIIAHIKIKHINHKVEYVKMTSKSYKELLVLNENKKQNFNWNLKKAYTYEHKCSSLDQLSRINLNKLILNIIENNYNNSYKNIIYAIYNNMQFTSYARMCDDIFEKYKNEFPENSKLSFEDYKELERKVFKDSRLNPVTEMTYTIIASYTSPAGRNRHINSNEFNFNNLLQFKFEVDHLVASKRAYQSSVKEERSKVTPSLRYDIFKRDNFRCQICGASANDGVKLHVDHIIPVSKGGKTEMSNLQTLCDRCNLGKSNKI